MEKTYDNLTGLPSMSYFYELAEAEINHLLAKGDTPAIVFFDITGMKQYNHKHGFRLGDELLIALASILIEQFGNENCSRFVQDHFVVVTNSRDVEDKVERLFSVWKKRAKMGVLPLRVGVYVVDSANTDIVVACDNAKVACDLLRNTYASDIRYYNKELEQDLEKKEYIISHLDQAIANKWINVYYQPIVRAINGRVCEEEALSRWIDPERGFFSPADFIDILEEAHLIYKLDLYVVDQVIEKIKTIRSLGLNPVTHSVNLSRTDFNDCDIVDEICARMDAAELDHSLLTIEITESIIASNFEYMKLQVNRFRELGFKVWMDDFGSGYSSLDVLHDLEFDLIKFDMHFLHKFGDGINGRIILSNLVRMATDLGIDTVCEGVETEEHEAFLQDIGCIKLQGYYYTKPLPLENVVDRYINCEHNGVHIDFESTAEMPYFENLSKINLYDLSWALETEDSEFDRFYNSIPMVVMELTDDSVRIARCNASYLEFSKRTFPRNVGKEFERFDTIPEQHRGSFLAYLIECANTGKRLFVDEAFPNGTTVHTFMRRIAINPVTGIRAVAIAVLSVTADGNEMV
ncbi:MAG: GGDEF domain-containing phosphodiesterase [Eubacterium sp.]|nr:GGDEF domain-containing phosphodiesterase [Eubacterium sp.]